MKTGTAIRSVGHPTIARVAGMGYDAVLNDDDLTPGEAVGATIGIALLQILGHVAVEAAADWADDL